MIIETCANRIWEAVLDSYGLNVEFTEDEVVVYQSAWEKEMKVRIKAILEEELSEARKRFAELEGQAEIAQDNFDWLSKRDQGR